MRTIRKGNDIAINWTVLRNDKEESFDGKTLNVYLCDKHGCKMPFTYSINNNIIQGIFYGKDQEILGTYSLVLVENEGLEDMVTLDYVDCFLLASKLKNTTTSGSDKDDELVTEVVSVQSIIDTTTSGIDLSKYALKSTVYTKEEIDAKLEDILAFADIGDFVYQPVKTYSSGMFVRLAFAVAINIEPEILIVDEALSVGDVFFQTKCYHKFEEFKKMGKTILFVSHDLGSVGKYCDRVVLLNKGKKLAEGEPKEMIDLYKRVMAEEKAGGSKKEEGHVVAEGEEWKASMILNPDKQEYGDKKAEIVDFGIFDSEDKITNTVTKFEDFSLKMKVHFHEDVMNPIFAFTIRDLKGTDLTGTNSMIEGEEFGMVEAGTDLTITFRQSLPLQKGQYLIQLGLTGYNGDELEVHHRLYDICCLQVFSNKVTGGYFDMETQFSWEKES